MFFVIHNGLPSETERNFDAQTQEQIQSQFGKIQTELKVTEYSAYLQIQS
jgi:hypothetical protein